MLHPLYDVVQQEPGRAAFKRIRCDVHCRVFPPKRIGCGVVVSLVRSPRICFSKATRRADGRNFPLLVFLIHFRAFGAPNFV